MRLKPILFLLAIVILAWFGWRWYDANQKAKLDAPNRTQAVAVKTAPAQRQDIPRDIDVSATVLAYETVAVRSRIDSQLMEVHFKDGADVTEGQLLFTLDDRTLRAALKEREAQLKNLKLQYDRARILLEKGAVSPARLDEAKAGYESQAAQVNSARVQLEYTRITAPISGRAGTINVTLGNNVKANDTQALVTINQVKPIRVQMSLSQSYYDAVRQGMDAGTLEVRVKRSGAEDVVGKLEYIDNAVDATSGTFIARAVFANENEALWPGMFVNASLRLGEDKAALTVPEVAVQRGQQGEFVFRVEENKATRTNIKVQRIHAGVAVLEDGELKEGEKVVTDGLLALKDGSTIREGEAPAKP